MTAARAWLRAHRSAVKGWAIVVVCLSFLAIVQINSAKTPTPLDPESAAPDGTKAFAELMREAGARVTISNTPSNGVAVLLVDTLSDKENERVRDWVNDGGTLVVADVSSPLADSDAVSPDKVLPKTLSPECDASYSKGVRKIQPNSSREYEIFKNDDSNSACFPADRGYFVVSHNEGDGRVIDIGTPSIFTNGNLGKLDNSVLLTNLMQPSPDSEIVWLETQDVDGGSQGDKTLGALIPPKVDEGIWQLLITAVFLACWRARRLGAPVEESQRVQIPASQLVVATGNMYQTADQASAAAAILRADVQQSFARMLGVSPTAPVSVLIQVTHDRTRIPVNRLEAVLVGLPVNDNVELVKLAQQLEYLYMEVARVR